MLNWQNVIDGHGIAISITGMLIVFSGLTLISLFIVALPKILALGGAEKKAAAAKAAVESAASAEPTEEDIIAVLALVLHAELEHSLGEMTHLTISRQQRTGSVWASAGKMRSLSEGGSHA